MMRRRACQFAALSLFALLVAAPGCNSGPPMNPGEGKVVFENGDIKDLVAVGASVQLLSTSEPPVHGGGKIEPDGKFSIQSRVGGDYMAGVPEGEYNVWIAIPEEDEETGEPIESPIDSRFLSYKTSGITWKFPKDEELVIKVTK